VPIAVTDSPVGRLRLEANESALTGVRFHATDPLLAARPASLLAEVVGELEAYFSGRLRAFSVPVAPAGTAFQKDVWAALLTIPYGATWSYAALAQAIGRPAAVRAVGAANGQNPIPIVIPCHRVIGSNGKLVGFGGGLDAKRTLLHIERHPLNLDLLDSQEISDL
jgi:methylated-DNA-[protein]-cysteine S-methyltransferase